jgi:cellulose synthase operon protein C
MCARRSSWRLDRLILERRSLEAHDSIMLHAMTIHPVTSILPIRWRARLGQRVAWRCGASRLLWPSLCLIGLTLAASCTPATVQTGPFGATPEAKVAPLSPEQLLQRGDAALARGRYKEAAKSYDTALASFDVQARAELGLRQVQFETGQYEAAAGAMRFGGTATTLLEPTVMLQARANAALGDIVAARNRLTQIDTPAARLMRAELLIQSGKRQDAHVLLMSVIEDYQTDRITDTDSAGMGLVARAAYLLRRPDEANEAFNIAEQASSEPPLQMLLWRVELFLEHHDPGHAEEVLMDVLERNPNLAEALVWLASLKLEEALDFDEARRLVERALKINPRLTSARGVLAAIALRDMQLEQADKEVAQGLGVNPNDLDLWSLRAATRFLSDDSAGFEQARDEVLRRNPEYARFYTTVGLYAEWEHRYDDIVRLMNAALVIDPGDAAVNAQLGLNLIRNGDDTGGLMALRAAFAQDPYNVRVYNTLNLYEKTIAREYTSVAGSRFNFRYPTQEKPVLERFVPVLLDAAWDHMVEAYQFTPVTPVGIELYTERESFAVRTSGLPQTAIQGVCFGKTLASMSPYFEKFNVGMTLWHELAHVFHIQLSANHVPRWFTEGLAEYETLIARPEWRREQDTELYLAFESGRLPKVSAMNEAFTRAEDISDVAVAYYASTQIVHMLVEKFGYPKVREMLVLWSQGKPSPVVFQTSIGISGEALDKLFEDYLAQRLVRFEGQFVPSQRIGNPERVREFADKNRKSPDALSRYAVFLMQSRDYEAATHLVTEVLRLDSKHPEGLWLSARLALRKGNGKAGKQAADKLIELGKDGYETQLLLSRALEILHDEPAMEQALTRAHQFDPLQTEALYGLLELNKRHKDAAGQREVLEQLVSLEEHSGTVFRSLVHARLEEPSSDIARTVELGKSAIYADMYDPASHVAYALALERADQQRDAVQAFEIALLAPGSEGDLAAAHQEYAEYCVRHGQAAKAKSLRAKAKQISEQAEAESEEDAEE